MACRADWYTRPPRHASRGREGSTEDALQFNPPVEAEECLLTILIVVFGSVSTQGPTMPNMVSTMETKNFGTPDEVRTLPKTRIEVVNLGDGTVMKLTLEPGWRWSEHVKPTAGTDSCQVP